MKDVIVWDHAQQVPAVLVFCTNKQVSFTLLYCYSDDSFIHFAGLDFPTLSTVILEILKILNLAEDMFNILENLKKKEMALFLTLHLNFPICSSSRYMKRRTADSRHVF